MVYSEVTYNRILGGFHDSWSRRSKSCFEKYGPGCFVYDTNKEVGEGMFFKVSMLTSYFPDDVAVGLQQMLEASTNEQLVAAVIFEDKIIGTTLSINRH